MDSEGIDLSPLHREIDTLKARLCSCRHQGTCVACQGFEMLRQQAQMVVSAASQPVLLQVAQEASAKDLLKQMADLQQRLAEDPRLQDLMGPVIERVIEDLGGPEQARAFWERLGFQGGPPDVPGGDSPG